MGEEIDMAYSDRELLARLIECEAGGKGVRFHTLNKICYYLDCNVGDILNFDGVLNEEDE